MYYPSLRIHQKRFTSPYFTLFFLLISLLFLVIPQTVPNLSFAPVLGSASSIEDYSRIPLHFEANKGQVNESVQFLARGQGYNLYLTDGEATLVLSKPVTAQPFAGEQDPTYSMLHMQLLGANPGLTVVGQEKLPGIVNYFIGNDPEQWQTNIPTFGQITYQNVYPDIDLVYYGNQQQLEYDFIVAPGADPNVIALNFAGADALEIDPQGNLLISIDDGGQVIQNSPIIYQEINGVHQNVDGGYVLSENGRVGFELGDYDTSLPLVIDPILVYATYLGGIDTDSVYGLAVDSSGNAYMTGRTYSVDFPTTLGAFDTMLDDVVDPYPGSDRDAYIVKLDTTGSTLIYATYIGGTSDENGFAIDVDSSGNAYITGNTRSLDFPVTPGAYDLSRNSTNDGFILKLNASGSSLDYASYLGGGNNDAGFAIKVDNLGQAHVVGYTFSSDYPTTSGAYDTTFNTTTCTFGSLTNNCRDVFVTKFNATGSGLLYSTFLGGSDDDFTYRADLDANGNIYVMALTSSSDFPTTPGAFDTTFNGVTDAFVAKLDSTGSTLLYGTYLGGSDYETSSPIIGGIVVDASGYAYVTGLTRSTDFPTTAGAFDTTYNGQQEPFITKLDTVGNIVYSTFVGGTNNDYGAAIDIDSSGNAYITGNTISSNLPITSDAFQPNLNGQDAFLLVLDATGQNIIYGSFLGGISGAGLEIGGSIVVDSAGDVYIAGITRSTDFPTTTNAFDQIYGGGFEDGFIAKIHLPCTVINLNDSGVGSLRSAIACANSTPGSDTITFQVAGTINVLSQLPTLSDTTGGTLIDGTTAPGYAGAPVIVLDGPGVGSFIRGLHITSADNEVRALQIQDFSWAVWLDGSGASGNKITRSYLGTDGITAIDAQIGIRIDGAPNNIIGTDGDGVDDALEGNVISGNSSRGISISGTGASGNVVAGNFIGTNATVTAAVPGQSQDGVVLLFGADNTRIGTDGNGTSDLEERNIISGNPGAGVYISGGNGAVIAGNYIGTDVTGTIAVGNATFNDVFTAGIYLGGDNVRIGTNGDGISDTLERNVISGNDFRGITINGGDDAIIAGNYIGVDASGSVAMGNISGGVFGLSGTNLVLGTNGDGVGDGVEGNVISANTTSGVNLFSGFTDVIIAGNLIGTDATGTAALGNDGVGVSFAGADKRVGTNSDGVSDAAERNIISGNTTNGINANNGTNVVIAGNYIGTDISGTAPLGNLQWGLQISGDVRLGTNADGVNDAAERNIISGNGSTFSFVAAVLVSGSGSTVAGNYIGTDVTGTLPMGNNGDGVRISFGNNHTIGGTAVGAGNIIANSGAAGIAVPGGTGNLIHGNSIFDNVGLGIDLGSTGVTANDSGDADTGANNQQNFPVITSVNNAPSSTTIAGTLNSVSNSSYTLEFFASSTADPSGFGEGESFLGSTSVSTDPSGDASFSVTINPTIPFGDFVTATATDSSGNTSEFSAAVVASCNLVVSSLANSGAGTLREAIDCANSYPGPNTITFSVAGIINITSQLPDVMDTFGGTFIDGTTAPGYSGSPVVILSGPGTGSNVDGFSITAADNVIRSLQISGFTYGIDILGSGAADNTIAGNYIGTDGVNTAPNATGIRITNAPDNIIGGNTSSDRNVISGNLSNGVLVQSSGSTGNIIFGNLVGLDAAGLNPVGNTIGIEIIPPGNTIGGTSAGEGNVVSGNLSNGISLGFGTQVLGNLIGTDITGMLAVGNGNGIQITGQNNQIGGSITPARNLISGNSVSGVLISNANASLNTVEGNYIGIDISGTSALPNNQYGIDILNAPNNTIGGVGSGNVISGNGFGGIIIRLGGATNNVIQGNKVGTDAAGLTAIPNNFQGILIVSPASNNTIGGAVVGAGNLVSGNDGRGITITNNSNNNVVQGNLVGTDANGTSVLANSTDGLVISGDNNIVGGTTPAARNVFSGNGSDGISIANVANNNVIQGNFIGTDISGTMPLGNSVDGIISNGPNNTIGGTAPGAGNVISSNGVYGIRILGSTGSGHIIQGNFIGTDAGGTLVLGNGDHGIRITEDNNTIGGLGLNEGNIIAHNGGAGVFISVSTSNSILSNSIFDNAVLGIDLSGGGFTNDPDDVDTGANNLQNYPVMTNIVADGVNITIDGTVDSTPNSSFILQFFTNSVCDISGFGEGETLIGTTTVATDLNGDATFSVTFTSTTIPGDNITATATDPNNNTSEFSPCFVATSSNTPPVADDDSYATNEDVTLNEPAPGVLDGDTDTNGDTLTAVLDTTTSNGSLTLNSDGSFSYIPNADYCGPDSFTYHANDGTADSNIATVTIDVICVNDAPVADNDNYSTNEDTVLNEAAPGVLGEDTDVDGDSLTAVLDTTTTNGTLTLNADGSFDYTPTPDYCGSDSFTYHANDGTADSNIATVMLDVVCVNDPPEVMVDQPAVIVDEGQTAVNSGTFSDIDSANVTLSANIGIVIDNGGGTWSWSFNSQDGPDESQMVTIIANDGELDSIPATFLLIVNNVAPTVDSITVPLDPIDINDQPVTDVSATFSDPANTNDEPYTCSVDYGDGGGPQAGVVVGTTCNGPNQTYTEAGVYAVTVTVTDKDGDSGSATATQFIVIYDPSGGFVTGGGWIDSPTGACPDFCNDATGKANFGFVSKYKKGQSIPSGNTEFNFSAGNLNFHSDAYQWLVINQAGSRAQYKGSGTINGDAGPGDGYKFMIWAQDLDSAPDTFRIKIWYEDGGEVVIYDNGTDQALDGGNIKIHDGK